MECMEASMVDSVWSPLPAVWDLKFVVLQRCAWIFLSFGHIMTVKNIFGAFVFGNAQAHFALWLFPGETSWWKQSNLLQSFICSPCLVKFPVNSWSISTHITNYCMYIIMHFYPDTSNMHVSAAFQKCSKGLRIFKTRICQTLPLVRRVCWLQWVGIPICSFSVTSFHGAQSAASSLTMSVYSLQVIIVWSGRSLNSSDAGATEMNLTRHMF